jgi:hypothetical protein
VEVAARRRPEMLRWFGGHDRDRYQGAKGFYVLKRQVQ